MSSGVDSKTGKSHRFKDRTGQRNGRLVFLGVTGKSKHKRTIWSALCDCGNKTETTTPLVTRSCGCLRSEMMAELGRSSKQVNPISRTKEYRKKMMQRLRANPEHSMQSRLSRLHRHALNKVGGIKTSPTFIELGYDVCDFVRHIEKQFNDGMSWDNMKEWQIDHIIPSSTAKTKDDVIALNQLSNLRPMWSEKNNKKKNKIETLL